MYETKLTMTADNIPEQRYEMFVRLMGNKTHRQPVYDMSLIRLMMSLIRLMGYVCVSAAM